MTLRTNEAVPQVLQTIDVPRRIRVLVPLHEQAVRTPQVAVVAHASVGRVVASQSMVFGEQSGYTGITLSLGAMRPSPLWTFADGAATTGDAHRHRARESGPGRHRGRRDRERGGRTAHRPGEA